MFLIYIFYQYATAIRNFIKLSKDWNNNTQFQSTINDVPQKKKHSNYIINSNTEDSNMTITITINEHFPESEISNTFQLYIDIVSIILLLFVTELPRCSIHIYIQRREKCFTIEASLRLYPLPQLQVVASSCFV